MRRTRQVLSAALVLLFAAVGCAEEAGSPASVAGPEAGADLLGVPLDGPAPLDGPLQAALADASPGETLEVIVDLEDLSVAGSVVDALASLGAGVVAFEHLSMLGAVATPSTIEAARLLPGVESVHLNRQLHYLNAQGVASIRADEVHAAGVNGAGVGIAIMDSGIDGLHADVAYPDKTVQNVKFVANLGDLLTGGGALAEPANALFVEDLPNTESSMGHGTHVAATAAGTGEASGGTYGGVAPGAHLVGLSVGDALFIFWTLAGFDWILEHHETYGIEVVNNSWGTEGAYDPEAPINEATRALHDAGITVVFAAGNSGPDANTLNPYAAAPWVIGVAAGCKLGDDPTGSAEAFCQDGQGRESVLASFSSRGVAGDPLLHPDVTAPGALIVSARASTGTIMSGVDAPDDLTSCAITTEHLPFYTCASGTSMAAPHVAGVVALLEEASGGTLTPDQALEALTSTARPLPGYGEWEVGAGYVDALAAVESVR